MATLYRPATRALLEATPRQVASVSFNHSAVLSSAAPPAELFESPHISETLGIFNAPVNPRDRNISHKAPSSFSAARVTSKAAGSYSESIYNNAIGLP
ncbi:hypothetical protein V8E55_002902 [Tylopilus felleus]